MGIKHSFQRIVVQFKSDNSVKHLGLCSSCDLGVGQARDPGIQLEPKSKGISTLAMIKATRLQLAAGPLGPRIQVSTLPQERGQDRAW